jgi:hypothetical protein
MIGNVRQPSSPPLPSVLLCCRIWIEVKPGTKKSKLMLNATRAFTRRRIDLSSAIEWNRYFASGPPVLDVSNHGFANNSKPMHCNYCRHYNQSLVLVSSGSQLIRGMHGIPGVQLRTSKAEVREACRATRKQTWRHCLQLIVPKLGPCSKQSRRCPIGPPCYVSVEGSFCISLSYSCYIVASV